MPGTAAESTAHAESAAERKQQEADGVVYRLKGKSGYRWVKDIGQVLTLEGAEESQTVIQGFITDITSFAREKSERERELEVALTMAELHNEVISSLESMYKEICVIDLLKEQYTVICGGIDDIDGQQLAGRTGSLMKLRRIMIERNLDTDGRDELRRFLDFGKVARKLRETAFVAGEVKSANGCWFNVTMLPKKRARNGNVIQILMAVRDTSEQKAQELEYQETLLRAMRKAADDSSAKTALVRDTNHKLRSSVSGLSGIVEMLERYKDDPEKQIPYRKRLSYAVEQLLLLVDDEFGEESAARQEEVEQEEHQIVTEALKKETAFPSHGADAESGEMNGQEESAAVGNEEKELEQPEEPAAGLHALLAEDNELSQEVGRFLLEEEGFEVDIADNGSRAVELFCQSEPGTYDYIFMDVQMPVMDGLEATRQIRGSKRKDSKKVRILAMTANTYPEDIRSCLDAGMDGHLSKPLSVKQLQAALREDE